MNERPHAIEHGATSAPPHVIEIDSIVLHAAPGADTALLAARIEVEVSRRLGKSNVPARPLAQHEPGVAGEVARTVARAIGMRVHGA
jgi:hypothetical protein